MGTGEVVDLGAMEESPIGDGVVASPLAEQVFHTLRGQIVRGELPPGHRLRIRDLAAEVGTSVMPVREAVRRLVESGLAEHEPYKGAKVRELELGEIENTYDARILIEGACARMGAGAADAAVADRMQHHWGELQSAVDRGDAFEALHHDDEILDELYRAAGNPVLVDIVHGLWDRCRPYRMLWAAQAEDRSELWQHKPELIAAVRSGDADEAEYIVRRSYKNAKTLLRGMLADD